MNKDIEKLIKNYPSLQYDESKAKIVCKWSGHELPLNETSINQYINGQKYQFLLKKNIDQTLIEKYSQFLVPTKNEKRKNQLFCKLTWKHVNDQPDKIEMHINGRKFQKALNHWNYCKENNKKYLPPGRETKEKEKNENENNDDEEFEFGGYDSSDVEMNGNKESDNDDNVEKKDDEDNDSLKDLYPDDMEMMSCDDDDDDTNKKPQKRKLNGKSGKTKSQPRRKQKSIKNNE